MKGIKLLFTLCVFAISLQTSFAQNANSLDGKRPSTEVKPGSCADVYAKYWDYVFEQSFTDMKGLRNAMDAAKTRLTKKQIECLKNEECGETIETVLQQLEGPWRSTAEFQKDIRTVASRAPNGQACFGNIQDSSNKPR